MQGEFLRHSTDPTIADTSTVGNRVLMEIRQLSVTSGTHVLATQRILWFGAYLYNFFSALFLSSCFSFSFPNLPFIDNETKSQPSMTVCTTLASCWLSAWILECYILVIGSFLSFIPNNWLWESFVLIRKQKKEKTENNLSSWAINNLPITCTLIFNLFFSKYPLHI